MSNFKENFIYGGISGIISRTITSPFERLKILQQNQPLLYCNGNLYNSLRIIIKKEGVLSLFNGNLINCLRIFPQSAIQVGTYESSKNYCIKIILIIPIIIFLQVQWQVYHLLFVYIL